MKNKPKVGQWWVNVVVDPPQVHKTGIVLFVGRDSKKRLLWEDCQGHIETDYGIDWSGWHHEPACTGWDWVPEVKTEQKWPQWYVPSRAEVSEVVKKPIAFYRRDGEHSGETFHTDGSSFKWGTWEHLNDCRVCSEREALDRILPEEFPQWYVSEDWIQTAYIKRIDSQNAVRVDLDGREKIERPWSKHGSGAVEYGIYTKVSQADAEARVKPKLIPADGRAIYVRCRRKDLPVVEAKTTATVTVYEVVFGDDLEDMGHRMAVGDSALNSVRRNWKYVSVVSTKTVEVML